MFLPCTCFASLSNEALNRPLSYVCERKLSFKFIAVAFHASSVLACDLLLHHPGYEMRDAIAPPDGSLAMQPNGFFEVLFSSYRDYAIFDSFVTVNAQALPRGTGTAL